MKTKTIISTSLLCLTLGSSVAAQTNTFPSSGNVGIGTATPNAKLDVNGIIQAGGSNATQGGIFFTQKYGENDYLGTFSSNYSSGRLILGYGAAGRSGQGSSDQLVSTFDNFSGFRGALRIGNGTLEFLATESAVQTPVNTELSTVSRLHIGNDGLVGVGTATPTHKLSVNGAIRAKEIIVDSGWSDFVFDSGYSLRPLAEVASHIEENGHLPDVPSAAVVESEGLSLGEAQKIMMQKIEELTLYVIEQDKKLKELESKLSQQNARYNSE